MILLKFLSLILLSISPLLQDNGESGKLLSSSGTTTYGDATSNSSDSEGANILIGMYIKTGTNAETINSCTEKLAASTNANGSQISCAIYSYNSTTAYGSLVSGCNATSTYTASSASVPAQSINLSFSGCSLAASTGYWIIVNTNDSGFQFQTDNCGGTCSGALGTSTFPPAYSTSAVTFGSNSNNVSYTSDFYRYDFTVTATP